ncbi:MAG: rhomboid family intramembrane serine protease [Nanoarchaeota archaeon]
MPKIKFYTLWIALVLILFFGIQAIFPGFENALILDQHSFSEPWKFVTSMFLHGSLIHLLSNLFALIFFGFALEKTIGSEKFLGVYLVSGVLANLISVNFYPSSLGASGAIMGIIGCLAIIRPMMNVWSFGMILPMFAAAIVWVFVDAIGIFIPSNTGHIAHLSGIAFGIIFGVFFRIKNPTPKAHKVRVPEHLMRRWETLYMGGD